MLSMVFQALLEKNTISIASCMRALVIQSDVDGEPLAFDFAKNFGNVPSAFAVQRGGIKIFFTLKKMRAAIRALIVILNAPAANFHIPCAMSAMLSSAY